MTTGNDILRQHLLSYLERHAVKVERTYTEQEKEEFVFHMTDWAIDLSSLAAFYANPDLFNEQQAHDTLYCVFFHILEHLLAAAEIYDDAPEIYGMLMRKKTEGTDRVSNDRTEPVKAIAQ
jgi:hypothetical protein